MRLSGFLRLTFAPTRNKTCVNVWYCHRVRAPPVLLTRQSCVRPIHCQVGLLIWQVFMRLLHCH